MFAHPELVLALLELVPGVAGLRFSTLEHVNADFAGPMGMQRYADMVWRLDGEEGAFYLLLEFQSWPDERMALRMLVYSGLLLQDLASQCRKRLLPCVVPVVLYTGKADWHAPLSLSESMRQASLEISRYQPEQSYVLLDQRSTGHSPIGALIRIETALYPVEVLAAFKQLLRWSGLGKALYDEVYDLAMDGVPRSGV